MIFLDNNHCRTVIPDYVDSNDSSNYIIRIKYIEDITGDSLTDSLEVKIIPALIYYSALEFEDLDCLSLSIHGLGCLYSLVENLSIISEEEQEKLFMKFGVSNKTELICLLDSIF